MCVLLRVHVCAFFGVCASSGGSLPACSPVSLRACECVRTCVYARVFACACVDPFLRAPAFVCVCVRTCLLACLRACACASRSHARCVGVVTATSEHRLQQESPHAISHAYLRLTDTRLHFGFTSLCASFRALSLQNHRARGPHTHIVMTGDGLHRSGLQQEEWLRVLSPTSL